MDWVWKSLREVKEINQTISLSGHDSLAVLFIIAILIFLIFLVFTVRAIEQKNSQITVKDLHIDTCEKKCSDLEKRVYALEQQLKTAMNQLNSVMDRCIN